jgi:F-type H+-transporting ATPase subunit b
MPQLAFGDYSPQVVWLVITFVVLYLLISRLIAPSIARTLGERESRLQGDIARAEKLRSEAEATLAAYRKAIDEARAAAQNERKQAAEAMAAEAARREGELAAVFAERAKAAEAGIAAAKSKAMVELRNVAGDAASDLVKRLVGVVPAFSEIAAAVEASGRERA